MNKVSVSMGTKGRVQMNFYRQLGSVPRQREDEKKKAGCCQPASVVRLLVNGSSRYGASVNELST